MTNHRITSLIADSLKPQMTGYNWHGQWHCGETSDAHNGFHSFQTLGKKQRKRDKNKDDHISYCDPPPFVPPLRSTRGNRRLLIRFLCTSWTDYIHNEGASFKADSCFSQSRGRSEVTVNRSVYLLTYLLTYSMVQSPSWEANWFAASQEIPRI